MPCMSSPTLNTFAANQTHPSAVMMPMTIVIRGCQAGGGESEARRASIMKVFTGGTKLITAQLMATGITWAIAIVGAFILLKLVDLVMGLRVTENEEEVGLDISEHGERAFA